MIRGVTIIATTATVQGLNTSKLTIAKPFQDSLGKHLVCPPRFPENLRVDSDKYANLNTLSQ